MPPPFNLTAMKVKFLKSHYAFAYKAGDKGTINEKRHDIKALIAGGYIEVIAESPPKKRQKRTYKPRKSVINK